MTMPLESLEHEVLLLPAADRRRLLDRVVASLDADTARDAAWDAMAADREQEASADEGQIIGIDDALAGIRARLT